MGQIRKAQKAGDMATAVMAAMLGEDLRQRDGNHAAVHAEGGVGEAHEPDRCDAARQAGLLDRGTCGDCCNSTPGRRWSKVIERSGVQQRAFATIGEYAVEEKKLEKCAWVLCLVRDDLDAGCFDGSADACGGQTCSGGDERCCAYGAYGGDRYIDGADGLPAV
jgi:hypothetical protein